MSHKYNVQVTEFTTIQEVAGSWQQQDYETLLDAMDFGDRSGLAASELREMCLMSLQDQEPEQAAYLVLCHVIGEELREGQLRNMGNEMRTEKLWEEYVEPAYHARLFTAGTLLYAARPDVFPKAEAVQVKLAISTSDAEAMTGLQASEPDAGLLLRLLAGGMDEQAVLRRLYGDQLLGDSFPNAADMIWVAKITETSTTTLDLEVISSGYWLDALGQTNAYEIEAQVDAAPADEE